MRARRSARGEPLLALVIVLGGWVSVRLLFWDAVPFAPIDHPLSPAVDAGPRGGEAHSRYPAAIATHGTTSTKALFVPETGQADRRRAVAAQTVLEGLSIAPRKSPAPASVPLLPPLIGSAVDETPQMPAPAPAARRWSADAWLLLRQVGDASFPASGGAGAVYGASQAGGVLRYRLAPHSRRQPAAYLRATAALNGSNERQAALGISARPLPSLPVVAAAELRAAHQDGRTRLRPAVMAVTEVAPIALPHRLRAEAYAQAGYVGGRFATGFADGQLRVTRPISGPLEAGGGVWGGAQKNASRLDLGPTAAMGLALGPHGFARLAVDYRFRIAGAASPSSGAALTLSAGF